jgi:holliday junction DNA helicase RuvA
MIGRIYGKLVLKAPPSLMVDVSGVGYEIEAPMSTFYKLPALGETVTLHTHLVVRDDAHLLFGFGSLTERKLFRDLIRVSAIGPKLALAILSGMQVDEFWNSVRDGDVVRFSKLPGIGKKTAERLIMELRDKAGATTAEGLSAGYGGAAPVGALQEARAALASLGYKPAEVERLSQAVFEEGLDTETLIQRALKRAIR